MTLEIRRRPADAAVSSAPRCPQRRGVLSAAMTPSSGSVTAAAE
ncbi:hypothetical protein [Microbacterium lacticum]|nr:hypothetical protein [Microbacterium lacticum]